MYNFYIISDPLKFFLSRILKFIKFSKVKLLLNVRVNVRVMTSAFVPNKVMHMAIDFNAIVLALTSVILGTPGLLNTAVF